MQRIQLGVVGLGLAFRELHWPVLREMSDKFEIVAICCRDAVTARRAASRIAILTGRTPSVFTSFAALLKSADCHAIDIAVPISLTPVVARAALEAGHHVFAEKPLADNAIQFRDLVETARAKNLTLLVGENCRYQRRFYDFHELVERGTIGRPLVYRANEMHFMQPDNKYARTSWRREGRHRGGYITDGGTHAIAGMHMMLNSEVVEVYGMLASFNPLLLGGQPDTLLLQLRFANGVVGQLALGWGAIDREVRGPTLYGDRGTLVLFGTRIELWTSHEGPATIIPLNVSGAGFREEWSDFHRAVSTGQPLFSSPDDALRDLRVLEMGIQSANLKRSITLV